MFKLVKLLAIVVLVFSIVPAVQARPVASSTPSCVPAGDTGLTTLIVAKNHQHITGMTIDATGCDVGIFVPPDSKNVVIRDDEIFGANIHAIFVQDSTHILIAGRPRGTKPRHAATSQRQPSPRQPDQPGLARLRNRSSRLQRTDNI